MSKKTSARQSKGANSSKTRSKPNSATVTGNCKSVKRETVAPTEKRYVRRDSTVRFVEVANEHMLRAWDAIHRNSVKERKAS